MIVITCMPCDESLNPNNNCARVLKGVATRNPSLYWYLELSNQLISKENEVHGDKKIVHKQCDISCNKHYEYWQVI